MRSLLRALLFAFIAPFASAQTLDCPAFTQAALSLADEWCSATGRNQACYGHALLSATPYPSVHDFTFQRSGDVVDIAHIQHLQLASMSLTDEVWGIALLKAQANLPDTLPGQNVVIVLFGDVALENVGVEVSRVPMRATTGVNMRRAPRIDAQNVIGSLATDEEVIAMGRLSDNSWILAQSDDGLNGWVSAEFLSGDVERLRVVGAEQTTVYGPMQAFILRSGVGDSACAEAPPSGILIQTPAGAGVIHLSVNGVEITLGSTVYLQAQDYLYVTVLEGKATLRAAGQTQVVPSRTQSLVPLGEDGLASGPPQYPQPYRWVDVRALPIALLDEEINLVRPLRAGDVTAAVIAAGGAPQMSIAPSAGAGGSGVSAPTTGEPSGRWTVTTTVLANTCDPDRIPVGKVTHGYTVMNFAPDGSSVIVHDWPEWRYALSRIGDNVYQGSLVPDIEGSQEMITLTLTTPTSYYLTYRAVAGDPNNGGCIFEQDESGVYVGP